MAAAAATAPARTRRADPRMAVTPPMLGVLRRVQGAGNGVASAAEARAQRNTIDAMVARGLARTWVANYGSPGSPDPVNDVRYVSATPAGWRAVVAAARLGPHHRRALAAVAAAPGCGLACDAPTAVALPRNDFADCARQGLLRRHYWTGSTATWHWGLTEAGALVAAAAPAPTAGAAP